ncbi:MAG: HEPN domain-containing protein [Phycisphaerales bacterium]|nr:MAG: HEPN domain-containing protein [Phycisphaerales bacterium]
MNAFRDAGDHVCIIRAYLGANMSPATTWQRMATENFAAVSELVDRRHWRSAVSRACFAAYARVTADVLSRGITFGKRGNPTHQAIPNLIQNNMPSLDANTRSRLWSALDALLKLRVAADYQPHASVDDADARNSASMMRRVFQDLGS